MRATQVATTLAPAAAADRASGFVSLSSATKYEIRHSGFVNWYQTMSPERSETQMHEYRTAGISSLLPELFAVSIDSVPVLLCTTQSCIFTIASRMHSVDGSRLCSKVAHRQGVPSWRAAGRCAFLRQPSSTWRGNTAQVLVHTSNP